MSVGVGGDGVGGVWVRGWVVVVCWVGGDVGGVLVRGGGGGGVAVCWWVVYW